MDVVAALGGVVVGTVVYGPATGAVVSTMWSSVSIIKTGFKLMEPVGRRSKECSGSDVERVNLLGSNSDAPGRGPFSVRHVFRTGPRAICRPWQMQTVLRVSIALSACPQRESNESSYRSCRRFGDRLRSLPRFKRAKVLSHGR